MNEIPLVDLKAQHKEVAGDVAEGFRRVIEHTSFILGKEVESFERDFAAFDGTQYCIGVANGTDALELILRAAGIGADDEVILPANTFIATALAVVRAGASPVLVDSEPIHHLIDLEMAVSRVTAKTRALIPVHLYGQMVPLEQVISELSERGILIVEDGAQAHGARRLGKGVGTAGLAAGVSFYPGKNLGAYGDAGAVLTNSKDLATRVRVLRNWGGEEKYVHDEIGFNSRLDPLQAVVLGAKLKRLASWNQMRREAAKRYQELLANIPEVSCPSALKSNQHVWHLYVIRVPNRDEVLKKLHAAGIGAGIHYPRPIHLQGAFKALGYRRGDFPVAESAAAEILSLPLYPHITQSQQERVVEELQKALD